jgi:hypothetical protein
MFRGALWPTVLTVAVGTVVSGVLVGVTGVLGALVGGLVACASSLLTLWLMRKTSNLPPEMVMVAVLGGFALKLFLLLGVMMVLRGVPGLHPKALAFTLLATFLVAAGAEALAFRRSKLPTLIIPSGDGN